MKKRSHRLTQIFTDFFTTKHTKGAKVFAYFVFCVRLAFKSELLTQAFPEHGSNCVASIFEVSEKPNYFVY